MGIIYNQESNRSELQKRLAQELSDKAKKKNLDPASDLPDGVDDSAFIKDTKQTTSLAWAWVLIVVAAVCALIWLFVIAGNTL
jgi:hypothetical protein